MEERAVTSHFPQGAALVAGGSGGIGRGISEKLAEQGSSVAIVYRANAKAAAATVEAVKAFGVDAEAWAVDLRDLDAVKGVTGAVAARFGRIHSGIYAAGPSTTVNPLGKITQEQFLHVLNGDVLACFNFIHATLPYLRDGGGGAMIGLTTMQLDRLELRGSMSSLPKAAVDKMFQVIALEDARFGVRAATVRSGWVDAGLGNDMLENKLTPEIKAALVKSIPMRRMALPGEIGEAVAFLASSRASYITGVSLTVDGGQHL
jgi:NAD(P)-dependent dehydrogenase (short-subunit alcohol dehydrogenase family)